MGTLESSEEDFLLSARDAEAGVGVWWRDEYVDADGASQDHRCAITRYVFLIDGGMVSWSSKKQELVTLLTNEAEYVAATHAAKKLFGFADSLASCSSHSKTQPPCSVTASQLLHSLMMAITMLTQSISTSGIISSGTLSRPAPSN